MWDICHRKYINVPRNFSRHANFNCKWQILLKMKLKERENGRKRDI